MRVKYENNVSIVKMGFTLCRGYYFIHVAIQWLRGFQTKSLNKIDTDFAQLVQCFFVLYKLSNGLFTCDVSYMVYRFDDGPIHRLFLHMGYKSTVYFYKVYGYGTQISE